MILDQLAIQNIDLVTHDIGNMMGYAPLRRYIRTAK
jgi:hypothetical protein